MLEMMFPLYHGLGIVDCRTIVDTSLVMKGSCETGGRGEVAAARLAESREPRQDIVPVCGDSDGPGSGPGPGPKAGGAAGGAVMRHIGQQPGGLRCGPPQTLPATVNSAVTYAAGR